MQAFNIMLVSILAGLLLLTIGFSYRERNIGVLLIWIGTLCMLGIMTWDILAKLNA